ncbi:MAG: hypothetical protein NXI22_03155 [bacterium]|nr:hypothetical protein [bacterium]
MPEKEPPITQQDELIEAVYEFADDELQAGTYPGDIEKMLIAKGLDPESARNAVEHVTAKQVKGKYWSNSINWNLWIGYSSLISGAVILFLYFLTGNGGPREIIGAIVAFLVGGSLIKIGLAEKAHDKIARH